MDDHDNDNDDEFPALPSSEAPPASYDPDAPRRPLTRHEKADWDLDRTLMLSTPSIQDEPMPRRDLASQYLARGKDPLEAAALLRRRAMMRVIPGGPG